MVDLIKQAIADNSKVGNMMSTYIDKKMMGKFWIRFLSLKYIVLLINFNQLF